MIEVDGSTMEGGGQILRTAISLSAVTGREVVVHSIRAKRKPPGLRPQHLAAVRAAAELCQAQVTGAEIGSDKVVFKPGRPRGGKYVFDVGTAGSVTLVLQTLLPIMATSGLDITVTVRGGTNVMNSPSVDYFEHIFLYHLEIHGLRYAFNVRRRGFYPVGGGEVELRVEPSKLVPIDLSERGEHLYTLALSGATVDLKAARVAERQLQHVDADRKKIEYVTAPSTGSYIFVASVNSKSRLGCDAVGRRGLRAEEVGRAAWQCLQKQIGPLDEYMSDQIVPYIALFGGRAKIASTTHSETNIYVCSLFPTRKMSVSRDSQGLLVVEAS